MEYSCLNIITKMKSNVQSQNQKLVDNIKNYKNICDYFNNERRNIILYLLYKKNVKEFELVIGADEIMKFAEEIENETVIKILSNWSTKEDRSFNELLSAVKEKKLFIN